MTGKRPETPVRAAQPAQPQPVPAHDGMRRLQIGIAGVLTVMLLVGMAGLIGDRARENAAVQGAAVDAQAVTSGAEQKAGSAPLEELGVQPVSKDQNSASGVKTPQAPPPATVPDLEPDPALARARQSKQ